MSTMTIRDARGILKGYTRYIMSNHYAKRYISCEFFFNSNRLFSEEEIKNIEGNAETAKISEERIADMMKFCETTEAKTCPVWYFNFEWYSGYYNEHLLDGFFEAVAKKYPDKELQIVCRATSFQKTVIASLQDIKYCKANGIPNSEVCNQLSEMKNPQDKLLDLPKAETYFVIGDKKYHDEFDKLLATKDFKPTIQRYYTSEQWNGEHLTDIKGFNF